MRMHFLHFEHFEFSCWVGEPGSGCPKIARLPVIYDFLKIDKKWGVAARYTDANLAEHKWTPASMDEVVTKMMAKAQNPDRAFVEYQHYKIIYRKYAGLYFIFGADVGDNELLLMETIHLFVELLDQYFNNVCELDIVFNFNRVYAILDEFILAGEVQDSSKMVILERVKELEKLE